MTDRPIIFSAAMIRALLDGRKTQTRRVLKRQPPEGLAAGFLRAVDWAFARLTHGSVVLRDRFPYEVGDRLWVREACWIWGRWYKSGKTKTGRQKWRFQADSPGTVMFDQDNPQIAKKSTPRETRMYWRRNSIHMPRWASRLTLIVESVKVERLTDISREDAIAEGCESPLVGTEAPPPGPGVYLADERTSFAVLWNSINGPTAWTANPWVVAVTFRTVRANIDAIKEQT